MKEKLSHAAGYLLFFVLISTSSCKKIIDEIVKHPNGAADNCRIEKVTLETYVWDDQKRYDTATIAYNSKGNPVSIRHSLAEWLYEIGESADKFFTYYPDGRLSSYLDAAYSRPDGSCFGVWWHKYTYTGANIVTDSVFQYAGGSIHSANFPAPDNYSFVETISTIELDNYGRIIKESKFDDPGETPEVIVYSYDNNGNLILPGITYNTSKHNFRQTHKVWQFITQNYSLNSSNKEVVAYNNQRLPSKLSYNPTLFWEHVFDEEDLDAPFKNVAITYSCK